MNKKLPCTLGLPPCWHSKGYLRSAFTLIELLVVIGIIGALSGIIGLALSGEGNSSTALQSGQSTISGLLASARGQAALTGKVAALLVNANKNNPDRYLRYCVVATTTATTLAANSPWGPVNDGVYLPANIYILPNALPSGSQVQTGVDFSTIVTSAKAQGFDGLTSAQAINSPAANTEQWFAITINSLGQRAGLGSTPANGFIILSVGAPQPPNSPFPFVFTNAQNVRGVSVSNYGVAGFINAPDGFE